MQSMTGYGRAEKNFEGLTITVEIKTVNNRFLDVVAKYPRNFVCFDDLIRKTVASKVSRGRVELFVSVSDAREKEKTVLVDIGLASGYVKAYEKLKNEFPSLEGDLSITTLARIPDVIVPSNEADDTQLLNNLLSEALLSAIDDLNEMRKVEGEKLKKDMKARMGAIESYVAEISALAPLVSENYRKRLEDRIKEALAGVNFDEARLLTEVAIFADKSNIDEELTRLKSHIAQFYSIIETENSGRKLDFLVQEFNREANTICSKSNEVKITDCGLKIKCEIEKIREQIQNIE